MQDYSWASKWQKELINFKGIKSTFIIEGNINDKYPIYNEERSFGFAFLNRVIYDIFEMNETKGYYDFLFYNPLFGFYNSITSNKTKDILNRVKKNYNVEQNQINAINPNALENGYQETKAVYDSNLIRTALTKRIQDEEKGGTRSLAVVLNYGSRYVVNQGHLADEENRMFLNLYDATLNAIKGNTYINTLILVVDKVNDIPMWFYINNPNVRIISIPKPDRKLRLMFIDRYFGKTFSDDSETLRNAKDKFADSTNGITITELTELKKLHERLGSSVENITETVAVYKYGTKENQWSQFREKLEGNIVEKFEKRVKGQSGAVNKVIEVLKRASVGMSGMQHSSGSKPKGILFFVGPTGTGKTEIVKTVAELLFEDENSIIRFDMSEYTQEHSDQKLFGAPPGYVGYDQGGQLTNAVKNNPCSILLFDEIEKAHPTIMDKFLQILEDGRMTDGQGTTVYFSETMIFFTSNAGMAERVFDKKSNEYIEIGVDDNYEEMQIKAKRIMEIKFKPEVLNRIGLDNIVVFKNISPEISNQIALSQISKINKNIYDAEKISIDSSGAEDFVLRAAMSPNVLKYGGRGVGNIIEEKYLTPLSEFIFEQHCKAGETIYAVAENEKLNFYIR